MCKILLYIRLERDSFWLRRMSSGLVVSRQVRCGDGLQRGGDGVDERVEWSGVDRS